MDASFYDVLGVEADAGESTVRAAYREAVKEHHPDVSDDPGTVERFKRLTRARDVLLDPDERARYDRLGHETYVTRHLHGSNSRRSAGGRGTRGEPSRTANHAGDVGGGSGNSGSDGGGGGGSSGSDGDGGVEDEGSAGGGSARAGGRRVWTGETSDAWSADAGTAGDQTPGSRRHRAREGRRRHVRTGPHGSRGPTGDPTAQESWQTASAAYRRSAAASRAAADRSERASVTDVLSRVGPWLFVYAIVLSGAVATAVFALQQAGPTVTVGASLFGLLLVGTAVGLSTLHVVSLVARREDG